MKRLDLIENRLAAIEKNQEKSTEMIEKISPMVEEYHAARILRKKWTEKIKFISLILGMFVLVGGICEAAIRRIFN